MKGKLWKRLIPMQAALLGLTCAAGLWAQDDAERPRRLRSLTYAAKFVCRNAVEPPPAGLSFPFGPAFYRTVVNVRNPLPGAVDVVVKALEARGLENNQEPARGRIQLTLQPEEVVAINCADIRRIAESTADPVSDGFVVVESRRRLNVTAVYSAVTRDPNRSDGVTLDVESIRPQPRFRPVSGPAETPRTQ